MLNKKVEKKAIEILEELNINQLPIPVEEIAQKRGLSIKLYDLGTDVSGVLVIDTGKGTIGVNLNEPKIRQRFTVAHELGHYELHKQETGLFIDRGFAVLFRNQQSSTGEERREQEANAFAAALLMPEKLLVNEIKNRNFDLTDEDSMRELAKLFSVSALAMTYRIANLNLF